ncbi:GNAT family N-acetyltransferase [Tenacibaculum maritimum]|uniref:GNAT family N-acetyltransferase n=1 Tax=Tenacibaculum maritimum TaxID=107401 RepID=UPI0012E51B8D|nr:GNAT family N-acetyltransferase [Tenacibaculum maritimum]MCD9580594.1 GNAT family N-acetyltransferase [Tenacibaculum maritimum]MCD9634507.1 GNAT family N-acetyltransferase [Tenacibaculum maritimum]CAA0190805.1 Acetyltransferase, GNAT family [Tenacibaculum maritimum]CAA0200606.1 Acetyltransferase, GNAT family [Tenacibaculum maritimum]CAA0256414.1 Acetyltransferase, GNAT family [Tenacibaculum maritimum]
MQTSSLLKLVPVELKDLEKLILLSKKTYADSFSESNSTENMNDYLKKAFNKQQLEKEIVNTESKFYFIKYNSEIAGYLKLNFGNSQTDIKDSNAMEIERIYILNKFQRKKIGQYLLDFAMEIANHRKLKYIWLGVWKKNLKAIKFYRKNGFKKNGSHPFKMGAETQTDDIMVKNI